MPYPTTWQKSWCPLIWTWLNWWNLALWEATHLLYCLVVWSALAVHPGGGNCGSQSWSIHDLSWLQSHPFLVSYFKVHFHWPQFLEGWDSWRCPQKNHDMTTVDHGEPSSRTVGHFLAHRALPFRVSSWIYAGFIHHELGSTLRIPRISRTKLDQRWPLGSAVRVSGSHAQLQGNQGNHRSWSLFSVNPMRFCWEHLLSCLIAYEPSGDWLANSTRQQLLAMKPWNANMRNRGTCRGCGSKRKTFHPERISDGIHSLDLFCIQNHCEDCLVAHSKNLGMSWIQEYPATVWKLSQFWPRHTMDFMCLLDPWIRLMAAMAHHFPCPEKALSSQWFPVVGILRLRKCWWKYPWYPWDMGYPWMSSIIPRATMVKPEEITGTWSPHAGFNRTGGFLRKEVPNSWLVYFMENPI